MLGISRIRAGSDKECDVARLQDTKKSTHISSSCGSIRLVLYLYFDAGRLSAKRINISYNVNTAIFATRCNRLNVIPHYSAPFSLSDSATVKAIAIKDGKSSGVASKSFTKASGGDDPDQ